MKEAFFVIHNVFRPKNHSFLFSLAGWVGFWNLCMLCMRSFKQVFRAQDCRSRERQKEDERYCVHKQSMKRECTRKRETSIKAYILYEVGPHSPPTQLWCLWGGSQALLLLTADVHTTALHRDYSTPHTGRSCTVCHMLCITAMLPQTPSCWQHAVIPMNGCARDVSALVFQTFNLSEEGWHGFKSNRWPPHKRQLGLHAHCRWPLRVVENEVKKWVVDI